MAFGLEAPNPAAAKFDISSDVYMNLTTSKKPGLPPKNFPIPPGKMGKIKDIQQITVFEVQKIGTSQKLHWVMTDGQQFRVPGKLKLKGDDSMGKIVEVVGGIPEYLNGQDYEILDMQHVVFVHVNKVNKAQGAKKEQAEGTDAGDPDDPACWVVIDGVSTYVCGCGP